MEEGEEEIVEETEDGSFIHQPDVNELGTCFVLQVEDATLAERIRKEIDAEEDRAKLREANRKTELPPDVIQSIRLVCGTGSGGVAASTSTFPGIKLEDGVMRFGEEEYPLVIRRLKSTAEIWKSADGIQTMKHADVKHVAIAASPTARAEEFNSRGILPATGAWRPELRPCNNPANHREEMHLTEEPIAKVDKHLAMLSELIHVKRKAVDDKTTPSERIRMVHEEVIETDVFDGTPPAIWRMYRGNDEFRSNARIVMDEIAHGRTLEFVDRPTDLHDPSKQNKTYL
jgi:hypothetical protein